jgi:hypothetical protein
LTIRELVINQAGEFISGQRCKCPACGATSTIEPSRRALDPKIKAMCNWAIVNCPKCAMRTQYSTLKTVELPDPEPEPQQETPQRGTSRAETPHRNRPGPTPVAQR